MEGRWWNNAREEENYIVSHFYCEISELKSQGKSKEKCRAAELIVLQKEQLVRSQIWNKVTEAIRQPHKQLGC